MAESDEETPQEERNRRYDQLLQEARVVMPGVQVLFAFLLAVAFQRRFEETTQLQQDLYLAIMLLVTASTICFIAPAAWHRILFKQHHKRRIVEAANRFVIAGMAFLAAAMTLALLLVCDFVFGGTTATVVAAGAGLAFGWSWFAAPVLRRRRADRSP